MRLEDRLSIKLLAQASTALGKALNEALCTQPDPRVVRALVQEATELIGEFGEHYGSAPLPPPARPPKQDP